jgi:hypothetical protein
MTQPPTDRDIIKAMLSEQDREDLISYWMRELTDWLNQHPVSSYEPKKEKNDEPASGGIQL